MKKKVFTVLFICTLWFMNSVQAADSLSLSFNADLVSRYVWRGLLFSPNPNVQPYGALSYKGLTFGAWGSFGISTPYAETDLYLSYNVGQFTFSVNDYYTASDDSLQNFNYFEFRKSKTLHALEGAITYSGPESFPISVSAATFFAGADDYDGDGKNDYSAYFELAYTTLVSEIPLKLFIGGTPQKGLYSEEASLVNVGVSATRTLKFNENVEIPVFTSLVVNPNSKDLFFVFGITF